MRSAQPPWGCIRKCFEETAPQPGDTISIIGLGPIGLMFVKLAKLYGCRVSAGGRRTRSETGIIIAATTMARSCIEVRQSWCETSQATSGDMVIGAIPMPADTSDTARLRWVSNQPVTQAIIGAKMAAALPPTRTPKN